MDQLKRQLHLPGAIVIGLGSILGTGVFVSLAFAAGIVQNAQALLFACVIGGIVAGLNGLSSAQLAAAHPVAGGTYEYGYKFLHPLAGYIAGITFLLAKTASAAAAALSFAAYLLSALNGPQHTLAHITIAASAVILLTALTLLGIKRTNTLNAVIVTCTVLGLLAFITVALTIDPTQGMVSIGRPTIDAHTLAFASAIVFVAYTGYGRIATMGEEVVNPRRTIPRAVVITLFIAMALYLGVAYAATQAVGVTNFGLITGGATSPLANIVRDVPWAFWLVSLAAITAMLGVLLNLILGLSRVLLAMGRRGDAPAATARLNADRTTPFIAVIVMGAAILAVVFTGNAKAAWQFSALTVLVYYALTNLAALRVPAHQRFIPRIISWAGLVSCLALAVFIPWQTWVIGGTMLAAACLYRVLWRRATRST